MHYLMRLKMLIAALALVFAASGAAAAPVVVASIKPLHAIAAAVMRGAGEPMLIVRGAADVHGYALRPSDARALAKADALLFVSPRLEHFLARASSLAPRAKLLEAARMTGVRLLGKRRLDPPGLGAPAKEQTDKAVNWHIWLSPDNARAIAQGLAETLADMDAGNAALYRANAKAFAARLDALTGRLEAMLKDARGKPFIVSHDATRYFEERFELRAIASIEPAGGGAPGMKRLLALVKLAREHPGICVFVTPDAPRAYAAMLKREAGARTALTDPAGALLKPGPELYPKLLENLASAFSGCLSGGN